MKWDSEILSFANALMCTAKQHMHSTLEIENMIGMTLDSGHKESTLTLFDGRERLLY